MSLKKKTTPKLHFKFIRPVNLLVIIMMVSVAACTGPGTKQSQEKPHLVFLISEDPNNYEAHETIPKFAEMLRRDHGYDVSVLLGEGERTAFHFPGLEALDSADLLVVFARRLALPQEQMNAIKDYLAEGKPLVGIRTANHAFSLQGSETPQEGYEAWADFVPDILGCENRGYGPVEPGTDVAIVPEAANHPILSGVEPAPWHSEGNVYLVAPLLDQEATVLLTGKGGENTQPIAWARMANKSRVFYTSLGYPTDFETPQFTNMLVNGIHWALNGETAE